MRIGDEGVIPLAPPQPLHPAQEAKPVAPQAPAAVRKPPAAWRKLAKDLLPPVITRAIVAARRRRR